MHHPPSAHLSTTLAYSPGQIEVEELERTLSQVLKILDSKSLESDPPMDLFDIATSIIEEAFDNSTPVTSTDNMVQLSRYLIFLILKLKSADCKTELLIRLGKFNSVITNVYPGIVIALIDILVISESAQPAAVEGAVKAWAEWLPAKMSPGGVQGTLAAYKRVKHVLLEIRLTGGAGEALCKIVQVVTGASVEETDVWINRCPNAVSLDRWNLGFESALLRLDFNTILQYIDVLDEGDNRIDGCVDQVIASVVLYCSFERFETAFSSKELMPNTDLLSLLNVSSSSSDPPAITRNDQVQSLPRTTLVDRLAVAYPEISSIRKILTKLSNQQQEEILQNQLSDQTSFGACILASLVLESSPNLVTSETELARTLICHARSLISQENLLSQSAWFLLVASVSHILSDRTKRALIHKLILPLLELWVTPGVHPIVLAIVESVITRLMPDGKGSVENMIPDYAESVIDAVIRKFQISDRIGRPLALSHVKDVIQLNFSVGQYPTHLIDLSRAILEKFTPRSIPVWALQVLLYVVKAMAVDTTAAGTTTERESVQLKCNEIVALEIFSRVKYVVAMEIDDSSEDTASVHQTALGKSIVAVWIVREIISKLDKYPEIQIVKLCEMWDLFKFFLPDKVRRVLPTNESDIRLIVGVEMVMLIATAPAVSVREFMKGRVNEDFIPLVVTRCKQSMDDVSESTAKRLVQAIARLVDVLDANQEILNDPTDVVSGCRGFVRKYAQSNTLLVNVVSH